MSRVREFTRSTALLVALALCFGTSCIFSPEAGVIPPAPPPVIEKPADVIDALSRAYQQRDPDLFAKLLANDPDNNANYLFILSNPQPGDENWGYAEEVRIHQRMFRPDAPPPGDPPVNPDIWLQSLTITLTLVGSFVERTDLYDTFPEGYLDPAKWRATTAKYTTNLFFELAGDTDYRVEGEAQFVVIEDRTKNIGDDGKFLLLIWEDLGGTGKPTVSDPA